MTPGEAPADAASAAAERPTGAPYQGPSFDQPAHDGQRRHYVICATGRSGSSLLCDLLTASGAMGVPREYLTPRGMLPLAQRLGAMRDGRIDLGEYLAAVMRVRTTPNGVFGIKLMWLQAERLIERRLLSRAFPEARFVYITRRDVIAQAVSYALAASTGQWMGFHEARREPDISMADIRKDLTGILRTRAAWETFFAVNDIAPLRVDYESLLADSHAACRSICRLVGVATQHRFAIERARLTRQASTINDEWIRRARQELAGY